MFSNSHAFSRLSVHDTEATKQFYGEVLGLNVQVTPMPLDLIARVAQFRAEQIK